MLIHYRMANVYEFKFVGDFNNLVFAEYENPSDGLKAIVLGAIAKEKEFLMRFSKVNKITQLITYDDIPFKVSLHREV